MAIPSISQFSQEPGGGLWNVYKNIVGGSNSLTQQQLANQYYAPIQQANAMSKLAYANLVGPQFLAKLMGNDSILANIPDEQKQSALKNIYNAGIGQSSAGNIFSHPLSPQNNGNQSLSSFLVDKMKNIFNQPSTNLPMNTPSNNSLANQSILSQEDKSGINQLTPGQSYVIKGNLNNSQPLSNDNSSFSENVGRYKGIVQEGEASGKIRAQDIKELNDTVFNGETNQTTLDSLSNILSSPEFEQIRQIPLAGHHELSYYSKFGTPEQQNMVGQYYTLTGNVIKDSARDFAGQFRKGEQQLLEGMKPNPSDTVDVARGKAETLSVMNKLLTERSRLTSEMMNQYHVNKLQAQEMADKKINGNVIRQQIHNKLNPTVTIRNRTTGEIMTVPIEEARKRGVPNV